MGQTIHAFPKPLPRGRGSGFLGPQGSGSGCWGPRGEGRGVGTTGERAMVSGSQGIWRVVNTPRKRGLDSSPGTSGYTCACRTRDSRSWRHLHCFNACSLHITGRFQFLCPLPHRPQAQFNLRGFCHVMSPETLPFQALSLYLTTAERASEACGENSLKGETCRPWRSRLTMRLFEHIHLPNVAMMKKEGLRTCRFLRSQYKP
jgi:hypothetical protein